jgi:hypothetical protein
MSIGDTVRSAASRTARGSISAVGIGQDDIIFAMVLFAFVVWITTRGELQKYLSFFTPGATQGPTTNPITATPASGSSTATSPATSAANAVFGNPNIPNPGLFGGSNPVGALTANPSTAFGIIPQLQAIPGALNNNLVAPITKFFGSIF